MEAVETREAKASLKYIRMSPRKMKVVLDLVRGKNTIEANAILRHTPRMATEPIMKLLNSATANAENNFGMDPSNLYISECFASEGPTLKRIRPRAKGRAVRINKRTSHVTMVLREREEN